MITENGIFLLNCRSQQYVVRDVEIGILISQVNVVILRNTEPEIEIGMAARCIRNGDNAVFVSVIGSRRTSLDHNGYFAVVKRDLHVLFFVLEDSVQHVVHVGSRNDVNKERRFLRFIRARNQRDGIVACLAVFEYAAQSACDILGLECNVFAVDLHGVIRVFVCGVSNHAREIKFLTDVYIKFCRRTEYAALGCLVVLVNRRTEGLRNFSGNFHFQYIFGVRRFNHQREVACNVRFYRQNTVFVIERHNHMSVSTVGIRIRKKFFLSVRRAQITFHNVEIKVRRNRQNIFESDIKRLRGFQRNLFLD